MTITRIQEMQRYSPAVYARLKESSANLLNKIGSTGKAAAYTRVGVSALYQYSNPNEIQHFIPVDVIADLELLAGDPVITRVLAAEAGYALIPISSHGLPGSLASDIARVGKETSDVFARMASALADGKLSIREARDGLGEIDEAISVLGQLRSRVGDVANQKRSSFDARHESRVA